ncbi:Cytochrome b5-like Heme/Steroid binding domain containing protein, putative [Leishmania lindenbergi]|uniref:Cytochrome b5-like Heme/Steroid binding domain containing protein n=1 Tax=Leishmania lindenbergi TaxID=651832 RepID=A0AAW3ATW0_9TRYP
MAKTSSPLASSSLGASPHRTKTSLKQTRLVSFFSCLRCRAPAEHHSNGRALAIFLLLIVIACAALSNCGIRNFSFVQRPIAPSERPGREVPKAARESASPSITTAMLGIALHSDPRDAAAEKAMRYAEKFYETAGRLRCPQPQRYTQEEVAQHKTQDDLWITVDGNVLNVSAFLPQHPGGDVLLDGAGGQDMATVFASFHNPSSVRLLANFCIGRILLQSFNRSASAQEAPANPVLKSVQNESAGQQLSQPSTPLSPSSGGQEYSQPIQVGSAPNVHPRYRRRINSPITQCGSNDSGSRSGFPNTPPSSLPPRFPFAPREDDTSAFARVESAPVQGHYSPPQYGMPLSGSFRSAAVEVDRRSQSPNPYYTAQGTPPPLPPLPPHVPTGIPGSLYGAQTPSRCASPTIVNGAAISSYAPASFSVPLTMVPVMNSGGSESYHGSLGGRGGLQSPGYVDPRSNHCFSSVMGCSNSAHPQSFVPAKNQKKHQSGPFPVRKYPNKSSSSGSSNRVASPPLGGAFMSGGPAGVTHRAEAPLFSGSYDTTTKTLSTMADETMSFSSKSSSSLSSIRDDLPLCPSDEECTLINDRKHQKKYAHKCRLHPCYHAHVVRHAKLFRHSPGQVLLPEGLSANMKISTHALASVNFSAISPEAPNAYRIYVSHGEKSYEIFGDWASVKVHTLKRYLHQVYHIAPTAQILSVLKTGNAMDDDISTVKAFGIEEDSVIQLHSNIEGSTDFGRIGISLADL